MEIVVFAVLAVFLFLRLWNVLGIKQSRVIPLTPETLVEGPLTPLETLKRKDAGFSEDAFIESAKNAFLMITKAYGQKDKDVLQKLLVPKLYEGLLAKMEEKEPEDVRVGHPHVYIQDIDVQGNNVYISLMISSSQGEDEDVQDYWTFHKDFADVLSYWRLFSMRAVHED